MLPVQPNTTCDIVHDGGTPASPDLTGVPIHLRAAGYRRFRETETSEFIRYTHIALVDLAVDVRDGWDLAATALAGDQFYIPDVTAGSGNNVFEVVFVARRNRNQASDHKVVYLQRQAFTWPSDDV
jgi:hypothetical protein